MNINGVQEIYASPNSDGTFYVRVSIGCIDQEHPLGKGAYKTHISGVLEFPKAKVEIIAFESDDSGNIIKFTCDDSMKISENGIIEEQE